MLVQVEDGSDEGVQAWREDICISNLKSVNKPEISLQFPRREGTQIGFHGFSGANNALIESHTGF